MPQEVLIVVRWIHFLAGITWIGLLYFFNLVNSRAAATIDASARPHLTTTLLPRALAWFRHSAWVTVLAGLVIIWFNYWSVRSIAEDNGTKTITTGGVLGIIMLLNVWGLIWPNQKKIIAATRAGEKPDASWGKTALYASRTNFVLSFPMLLFMGSASHFPMDWPAIVVVGVITAAIGYVIVMYVQKWGAQNF